jgi:hypothetical protein
MTPTEKRAPWPREAEDRVNELLGQLAKEALARSRAEERLRRIEDADEKHALALDVCDAALAAWDCIQELPPTQARSEVCQGIHEAITNLLGDVESVGRRVAK